MSTPEPESRPERIYAVPRSALFGGGWPQGFVDADQLGGSGFVERAERLAQLRDRGAAESDPSWKQLIPYCVVLRGQEVFCARRLARGSEARLHGRLSIGFGGHVDSADGPAAGAVARALARELEEELVLPPSRGPARFLGILNDDDTDVGRVHLGLVFAMRVRHDVRVRETHKIAGQFVALPPRGSRSAPVVDPTVLWLDPAACESWSAAVLAARPWLRSMGDEVRTARRQRGQGDG